MSLKNDPITVVFNYKQATKNKFRYEEVQEYEYEIVGGLYIRKSFLNNNPPQSIRVTIEEE